MFIIINYSGCIHFSFILQQILYFFYLNILLIFKEQPMGVQNEIKCVYNSLYAIEVYKEVSLFSAVVLLGSSWPCFVLGNFYSGQSLLKTQCCMTPGIIHTCSGAAGCPRNSTTYICKSIQPPTVSFGHPQEVEMLKATCIS